MPELFDSEQYLHENNKCIVKKLDALQENYQQQVYHCITVGMSFSVFFYTLLFVVMTVVWCRIIKETVIMAWQDVLLLSVLNFVGSLIAGVVNGLLIVKINEGIFILFDEKPDLLWKFQMIAVLIFAGETALIYFWQRYRVLRRLGDPFLVVGTLFWMC